jgi:membrane protein DedA with SNARE-associated domain
VPIPQAALAGAAVPQLMPSWLDPTQVLTNAGAWALWATAGILFAECGLLVGFFLPGDTLLFSVGLFVSQDIIDHPIWLVCIVLAGAALLGNIVGYEIGRRAGPPILEREGHRLVSQEHVARTQAFFDRYGAPAIILARFVPIVRTVITVTAGVARMDRRRYLIYSTLGAIVWASGLTLVGWRLGRFAFVREHIQPHLELIVLAAVALTVLPVVVHVLRERRSQPVSVED